MVKRGALENRLDAIFYKIEYQNLVKTINNAKYKTVFFKEVFRLITNGYDFRDYKNYGTPYIKVANVKKGEFDFSKIQYIEINSEDIAKAIQLKRGNLLLTRKGTYGNALSLDDDYDYVISSEVFYLSLVHEKINSKYLEIFFNSSIGQMQFNRVSIGAIMGSLSQDVIRTLRIPLPPLEIQSKIVEIFNTAYAEKRQKEAEAKELLASIDAYLLEQLGIVLPDKIEEKNIFYVPFSKVQGNRFDPFYHKDIFRVLEENMSNGKYEIVDFKKTIIDLKNGVEIRDYSEIGFRYLRVTDLDKNEINNTKMRFVNVEAIPAKILLNKNCLLISRSGSLGLVSIVTDELLNVILSSHIFKAELDINITVPEYLEAFFRSILGQKQFFKKNNGGVIPEINQEALKSIQIPLPPLEIQTEIANHIRNIRERAKTLENEAKEVIEKAKAEIEKMILG